MKHKEREAFNAKVTRFLSGTSNVPLPEKVLRELALFYSDRKIFTRLYCSSCGFEGVPEDEEVLPNGALADICPECHVQGCMCSYTELQWRKKCRAWNIDYMRDR